MPSEALAQGALAVLDGPRARFDETLTLSIEEIQGFLNTHRDPEQDQTGRVAQELGTFAAGRIDVDRFAALLQETQSLDREVRHELEVALETLTRLKSRGEDLYVARVAPGGDLRDTVAKALSEVGRAFAAARLVEAARDGASTDAHDASQKGFPFRKWSRDERGVAPPLIVQVAGEDLVAGGLAEFLDGSVKLALVVDGKAPAASLAGLLASGLWVEQVDAPDKLTDFAAAEVPGVAAVVPDGCALFRFDGSGAPGGALEVSFLPEDAPKVRVGSISAAQQARDLDHLRAMSESAVGRKEATPAGPEAGPATTGAPVSGEGAAVGTPQVAPAAQPAVPASDPAGALAGWLLQNADLSGS
jgi:hypothetical protein